MNMKMVLMYLWDFLAAVMVSLPLVAIYSAIFDRERLIKKWLWLILFVLYMDAAMILVGVPSFGSFVFDPTIQVVPFQDRTIPGIALLVENALLFVPFGGFLCLYFKRYRNVLRTLLAGLILSLIIEILQLFTSRTTDVNDLIMNLAGTLVGYLIALIVSRKKDAYEKNDFITLLVILVIVFLVVVFARTPLVNLLQAKLLG